MDAFQSPLHRGLGSDNLAFQFGSELVLFQSPLHRGLGSDQIVADGITDGTISFNPLFIGAWVRTSASEGTNVGFIVFQSPLHRGLGSDA